MSGDGHAGFGRRLGETRWWKYQQGAPSRPHQRSGSCCAVWWSVRFCCGVRGSRCRGRWAGCSCCCGVCGRFVGPSVRGWCVRSGVFGGGAGFRGGLFAWSAPAWCGRVRGRPPWGVGKAGLFEVLERLRGVAPLAGRGRAWPGRPAAGGRPHSRGACCWSVRPGTVRVLRPGGGVVGWWGGAVSSSLFRGGGASFGRRARADGHGRASSRR